MAPKEPQPCVEGTKATRIPQGVESGACPGQWHGREGSYITGNPRRILYDTEARSEAWLLRLQRDSVRARNQWRPKSGNTV